MGRFWVVSPQTGRGVEDESVIFEAREYLHEFSLPEFIRSEDYLPAEYLYMSPDEERLPCGGYRCSDLQSTQVKPGPGSHRGGILRHLIEEKPFLMRKTNRIMPWILPILALYAEIIVHYSRKGL